MPISYIPSMIPDSYKLLFGINPLYYYCIALQGISVEGAISLSSLLIITLLSTLSFALSMLFYKKSIPLVLDTLSQ